MNTRLGLLALAAIASGLLLANRLDAWTNAPLVTPPPAGWPGKHVTFRFKLTEGATGSVGVEYSTIHIQDGEP